MAGHLTFSNPGRTGVHAEPKNPVVGGGGGDVLDQYLGVGEPLRL